MGFLFSDSHQLSAIATFEDGCVYTGSGFNKNILGTYDSSYVYDNSGNQIAKLNYDKATSPFFLSTTDLCTARNEAIYKGGSSFNPTLAYFSGDVQGACAAAVLLFRLYEDNDVVTNPTKKENSSAAAPSSTNYNTTHVESALGGIGAVIIAIIIGGIATYAFYFTSWGHQMVFEEDGGKTAFTISVVCAIIGVIIVYISKDFNGFFEILMFSSSTYFVVYIAIEIIAFVESNASGQLNFFSAIALLIGGLIGAIGVVTPIFIIEAIVAYIAKRIKNKQ